MKEGNARGKDDSKWGYGEIWDYLDKDEPEEKDVFFWKNRLTESAILC
ncbi:hypothetical protein [Acidaminococcus timonensis]